MRLLKIVSLILNEGFGRVFFGWSRGESRLLDYVGECTEALFASLYQRALHYEDSVHFLHRRLLLCLLTGPATAAQVTSKLFPRDCLSFTQGLLISSPWVRRGVGALQPMPTRV